MRSTHRSTKQVEGELTFRDSYILANDWKRRIILISLYHNSRLSKRKNWKLTDSAKYFGISLGLTSESLNLAENWELIKECQSRADALRRLKNGSNV